MGRNDKRKYQNCAFSFKRKRAAWNNSWHTSKSAESDKGSFYNQKEWWEGYEYGKDMFYSEYGDDVQTSASIFLNKFTNVLVKYF